MTYLLDTPTPELVLEPKGAGGTVETYLITALLDPKPNWLNEGVVSEWKKNMISLHFPRFL